MKTTATVLRETTPETSGGEGNFLLINKPRGWTSFDVVRKVRGALGVKKVGHAGTLDPMATGLLIVCTGKATKEIERFQDLEKEYRVLMTLGGRTESYDAETPVVEQRSIDGITEEKIRRTLDSFVGRIVQYPPMWSAVKLGGKRLYHYARKGKTVERKPREVTVSSITLDSVTLPEVRFTVICSKGTYIRTLVDDVGQKLGCGAYVSGLERRRIGPYTLDQAMDVSALEQRQVGEAAG
jgi:tRNA pseudouridine55 synthase